MSATVYIIKPDGMPFRHTIRQRFLKEGLRVAKSKVLRLPTWAFDEIYPRHKHQFAPEEAMRIGMIMSTGGESEVGILVGSRARERLLLLCGKRADPAKCAAGTIRADFGISTTLVIDGYAIHHKVIHRPETWQELQTDLPIVRKLLGI